MTSIAEPSARAVPSVWDGNALFDALTSATTALVAHQREVDALNVFPVPDGDTGSNMAMTMRSALEEACKLTLLEQNQAGAVARRFELGALMGARGNSGVILSQIFRGFANAIADRSEIDGRDIVQALAGARTMAYKAVLEPVEGTMLTVIRVAAEHAERASRHTPAIGAVTSEALHGAEIALARTPELLDKLREAGVVDAGGQGLVHLLRGLDQFARGEASPSFMQAFSDEMSESMEFLDRINELHGEDGFGYCTNFMIFGENIPFDRVRADLADMGQSAVIVGDESIVKAHIHTENPGRLLEYAVRFGELGQIKIDNMNRQVGTLVEYRKSSATRSTPFLPAPHSSIGIVAVAAGAGLAESLRSMGVYSVIEGGQAMNPSVEELLDAVENAASDEIIILPNNPNALMAAGRVPELTRKCVAVVPSCSIPQSLAALESFNEDRGFEQNVSAMIEAVKNVETVEVVRAGNNAQIRGLDATQGQFVGLLDDRLVASGDDPDQVAIETIRHGRGEVAELITVFIGEGGPPAGSAPLANQLSSSFENAEIQVYDGGQPHCRYIIAVE